MFSAASLHPVTTLLEFFLSAIFTNGSPGRVKVRVDIADKTEFKFMWSLGLGD